MTANNTVDLDEVRLAKRAGRKVTGRIDRNVPVPPKRRRDDQGGGRGPRSRRKRIPPSLIWGFLALAVTLILLKPLAGWLMGPYMLMRMRTAPAVYTTLETGVPGEGVLIRDEAVILSPTAGRLHMLSGVGERVRKGTDILRVDDMGLGQGGASSTDKEEEERQRVRMAKAQRLSELKEEAARLQGALDSARKRLAGSGDAKDEARAQMRDAIISLKRVMVEEDEVQSADPGAASLINTREKGVWAAFGKDSYTFRSPMPGIVSTATDGLEGALNMNGRLEDLPRIVEDVASSIDRPGEWKLKSVKDGDEVKYGSRIGRIINNFTAHLAVVLPEGQAKVYKGDRVRIRFDSISDVSLAATHYKTIPGSVDGQAVAIFIMDEFIPGFTDLRADKVELVRERYEGVVVPKRAVTVRNGTKGVYIAKGWYPVWQRVEVKAAGLDKCVVSGLPAGNRVVTNPSVVPGYFAER